MPSPRSVHPQDDLTPRQREILDFIRNSLEVFSVPPTRAEIAGALGGALWAAIVALLRDRFNANEILVSLMLVYVAEMLLSYLVYGPWKDPKGYNFPQTITFLKSTQVPRLFDGSRVNLGLPIALVLVAAFWVLLFRTYAGFQLQVGGLAPAAARYAGFSSRRALWTALLVSGGAAGLAGAIFWSWMAQKLGKHRTLMLTSVCYAFTQSALMNSGLPTAPTRISAWATISGRFLVREWQIVTVAFFCSSIIAIGLPRMGLRPTTTACLPSMSMP